MSQQAFKSMIEQEIARIDDSKTTKRQERIIEGFTEATEASSPKAIIAGKEYSVFNSNDYLGLRHHPEVLAAEHAAAETYGAGPGAVRFISGALQVHRETEQALAKFHGREDAIVYSSAFAANMAVLYCLVNGLTKTSLIDSDVVVISDALNHRSIIDGVRISQLPREQRPIFEHMNVEDLRAKLAENADKHKRAVVVTDGIFSMIGEAQHLKAVSDVVAEFQDAYEQGVILVVDDAHGVGIYGETGRGVEETEGAKVDLLVGTLGKAFGTDGGYVVGDQYLIDYLRESSATYIYSNCIAPGTAGASLRAVQLLDEPAGKELLAKSRANIAYFQEQLATHAIPLAAESDHPIQPVLIGDTAKNKAIVDELFDKGFLATNISYPVVSPGRDEIRVQISAAHTHQEIDALIEALVELCKKHEIIAE